MLVSILCLTYMMILLLIHVFWIASIVKHNGKCRYQDCRHCPYDDGCPMQSKSGEEGNYDIDGKFHS